MQIEHVEKDKEKKAEAGDQTEKLEWIQERMRDDFAANQALRRSFRVRFCIDEMFEFGMVFVRS